MFTLFQKIATNWKKKLSNETAPLYQNIFSLLKFISVQIARSTKCLLLPEQKVLQQIDQQFPVFWANNKIKIIQISFDKVNNQNLDLYSSVYN